jgi:hypothetical protein
MNTNGVKIQNSDQQQPEPMNQKEQIFLSLLFFFPQPNKPQKAQSFEIRPKIQTSDPTHQPKRTKFSLFHSLLILFLSFPTNPTNPTTKKRRIFSTLITLPAQNPRA